MDDSTHKTRIMNTASYFCLHKQEVNRGCVTPTSVFTSAHWSLSTLAVIPGVLPYLYFLLVRELMLHQRFSDVIRCWVVFGSGCGLFVKVQLGHQRVTVYGRGQTAQCWDISGPANNETWISHVCVCLCTCRVWGNQAGCWAQSQLPAGWRSWCWRSVWLFLPDGPR